MKRNKTLFLTTLSMSNKKVEKPNNFDPIALIYIQAKLSNHGVIIFTKFHEDSAKIVDFLITTNHLISPLFLFIL